MLDQNSFRIFGQWAKKYGYRYTVIDNIKNYLGGCIEEGNSCITIYKDDISAWFR